MEQCSRPFAMNRDSSLRANRKVTPTSHTMADPPVDEFDAHTECITQTLESEAAVRFEELAVSQDSHLADVIACMG